MKILMVGLPGSGKSTQVDRLAEELHIPVISMGNLLREIASSGSEIGEKIKEIMSTGELVDDETVAEIIKDKIAKVGQSGFIMEGYPRTLKQVHLLDPKFDRVFQLVINPEIAKVRLKRRGRSDDSDDAITTRLRVQMEDMEKILNYYRDELVKINGTKTIDEVARQIEENLPKENEH